MVFMLMFNVSSSPLMFYVLGILGQFCSNVFIVPLLIILLNLLLMFFHNVFVVAFAFIVVVVVFFAVAVAVYVVQMRPHVFYSMHKLFIFFRLPNGTPSYSDSQSLWTLTASS